MTQNSVEVKKGTFQPERLDNQININICTEEENVLEVLSGVDHRKKRT